MSIVSRDMSVVVTEHAYWRSAERYPDFDTLDIEQDVREAYEAGRVRLRRPSGFFQSERGYLHAWSRDRTRCWVLAHADEAVVVITALARKRHAGILTGAGNVSTDVDPAALEEAA